MKKVFLTLALVCSAAMAFAATAADSTDVKGIVIKHTTKGVTYDLDAGEAKIAQLNQMIETYKTQMSQSLEASKAKISQSQEASKAKIAQEQEANQAQMTKELDT